MGGLLPASLWQREQQQRQRLQHGQELARLGQARQQSGLGGSSGEVPAQRLAELDALHAQVAALHARRTDLQQVCVLANVCGCVTECVCDCVIVCASVSLYVCTRARTHTHTHTHTHTLMPAKWVAGAPSQAFCLHTAYTPFMIAACRTGQWALGIG